MPTIVFDVFIPRRDGEAPAQLHQAFTTAVEILVSHGRLTSAEVTAGVAEGVPPAVVAELAQVYTREHGRSPGEAQLHRFAIAADAPGLSYNDLAMSLARILTPRAQLPADPVALERQLDFEVPALYPWTVEIRR
ncbi:hypothetical protein [Corynebacterium uterequi]|uniref:Uncharacterized protein n=1 Tax=Corynebacterium uterequi TaxID=1072256 RepID=A0A0G3HF89_9CORY|nr:hypothetical protein [Corynebacterium uterequi]AKK11405.1 hypothetical protein CUTER_07080 [Corynebacterium uterequi]